MYRTPLFLLVLLFALLQTHAQTANTIHLVTTVVDQNGDPLPGAVARIEGNKLGMIANEQGQIDLLIPAGKTLLVSYAGMHTERIVITKPFTHPIVLKDNVSMLDQVVVTGYAQTTKKRSTGSVAVVSAKDLPQVPGLSADKMLQGAVAGVSVKAISGRPGEAAQIRIRGTNTLDGNAEPLWVVDGVPLQRDIPNIGKLLTRTGDFSQIYANGVGSIPPSEIESITILKDASATAIYGSQAAGGVIVVTTKRGAKGKLQVSYNASLSYVTAPPRSPSLLNAAEKVKFEDELWQTFSLSRKEKGKLYPIVGEVGAIRAGIGAYAGLTTQEQDALLAQLSTTNTNWFNVLFRDTYAMSHNLALSGGTDAFTYYTSLGHERSNGILHHSNATRSHADLKLDANPTDRLKLAFSVSLTQQQSHNPYQTLDPFTYAYFANPYEKPYNPDGTYAPDRTWKSLAPNNGYRAITLPPQGFNIMRELDHTHSNTKNIALNLLGTLSYKFNDNLTFDAIGSYGYVVNTSDNTVEADTYAAWTDRPFEGTSTTSLRTYASNYVANALNSNYLLRAQLNFFTTLAKNHHISALLGSEARRQRATLSTQKRYGYDSTSDVHSTPPLLEKDKYTDADIRNLAALMTALNGRRSIETAFASFYFSADYAYKGRYVLSFTARTDGSNNFGAKQQFNPTGSLGVSWNIHQEPWMEVLQPLLSTVQLRAAAGFTGNAYRAAYPQLVMEYVQPFRRTQETAYRRANVKSAPNDKLRWESTRDAKLGLDVGLYNDRYRLSLEVYDRLSSDVVSSMPLVSSTGFREQTFNAASIRNQGAEVTLSAQILRHTHWGLSATANLAYNKNILVKMDELIPSYLRSRNVGYPLNAIFSGKIQGINPLLGIYTYAPRPGEEVTTPLQRQNLNHYIHYIGTSTPPYNGGFSISGRYKKTTLTLGGSFAFGGWVESSIIPPTSSQDLYDVRPHTQLEPIPYYPNDLYAYHLNTSRKVLHRWTPENPTTSGQPRIIDRYGDRLYLDNYMVTQRSITKASMLEKIAYLRLSHLSASYNLDFPWVQRIGIAQASISATVSNLALFTNYSGFDPETPGAVYPTARSYNVALNLTF